MSSSIDTALGMLGSTMSSASDRTALEFFEPRFPFYRIDNTIPEDIPSVKDRDFGPGTRGGGKELYSVQEGAGHRSNC